MDLLMVRCNDGSCCCMTEKTAIVHICIINLIASVLDALTNVKGCSSNQPSPVLEQVLSFKALLITMFRVANLMLLLSTFIECVTLIHLYVWYSLGFIVMCLMITIVEFMFKLRDQKHFAFVEFVVEVVFLGVTARCLPIVDNYRKTIDAHFGVASY